MGSNARLWSLIAWTVAGTTLAQPAAADWQAELSDQILAHHRCELAFLTQVMERPAATGTMVAAKAHCVDGRSFDALRAGDFEPFTLELCTPVDQRAC